MMNLFRFSVIFAFLLWSAAATAQSLLGSFMNGKGKGTVALSYTAESYDNVFLVPADAEGVPVFNEVEVNSVSLFGTYGISDRLDVVAALPHISATGNASQGVLDELGFENNRSGIQDLSLFVRYNPLSLDMGDHSLNFMLGGGISTPLGGYEVDEGLQSILAIGNRATSFNGLAMAQFRTASGVFLTTQAGYSLRSGEVPNAVLGEIRAGYAGAKFYVDAWYAGQVSTGGVNILGEGFNGFFPATDVSFSRAGITLFAPIASGFGVSVSASRYLNGRNVGEATGFSGAVTYSF
ncbi:MAG: hypothetical protein RIC19_13260 [Phaeodactylibacter sp.]|uniref:hypothetical protein n=1 Tax=Phaeodactylibacter sp. TaxID=1940289 RepID=UPI0032EC5DAC